MVQHRQLDRRVTQTFVCNNIAEFLGQLELHQDPLPLWYALNIDPIGEQLLFHN